MMKLSRELEKNVLMAVLAILIMLIIYRIVTTEKPKTAPLAFPRGYVAHSSVRQDRAKSSSDNDSLNILIAKRGGKFPGVLRDIFTLEILTPRPKPAPLVLAPPIPEAQRTPEEIAAEQSRAELLKFRFLGYLTDRDRTLFLSREGELFIVKSGDRLLKSYQVKEAGKDYVLLVDTMTNVEVRVELSGSEPQQSVQQHQ